MASLRERDQFDNLFFAACCSRDVVAVATLTGELQPLKDPCKSRYLARVTTGMMAGARARVTAQVTIQAIPWVNPFLQTHLQSDYSQIPTMRRDAAAGWLQSSARVFDTKLTAATTNGHSGSGLTSLQQ